MELFTATWLESRNEVSEGGWREEGGGRMEGGWREEGGRMEERVSKE